MKKVASLFVALLLVFTTVFSLSSCLSSLRDALEFAGGENTDVGNDNGGSTSTDNPTGGDGGTVVDGGGNSSDSGIEFYPNSGTSAGIVGPAKSLLSVVSIVSSYETSYGQTKSVGSGVIYELSKDAGTAYIITNYHVIYNRHAITDGGISEDINLYLYGMELEQYKIPATYIGGSLTQDLALLKVENSEVLKNSYARCADFGNSDKINVMDEIIVVGNPEGYGISVTTGIVSVDSETLDMTGADGQTSLSLRVIRIDAAVNEGNSGGGLFDENGDLIGIVNAKRTGSDTDNIAYAIPLSYAKNFADNIKFYCDGSDNRSPYKCLLGVTVTNAVSGLIPDVSTGELIKADLVEVSELSATSILRNKLEVGDRLISVSVDGSEKKITRVHHLIDHMLKARVGSTVTIEAQRDGVPFSVTVVIPESALTYVR